MTRHIASEGNGTAGQFTVVQSWEGRSGMESDTSLSRLETLEPISFRGAQQGVGYNLSFSKDRVTGTRAPHDSSAGAYEVRFDAPTYNEVIDDLMVSALPLHTGYAVRYLAYSPGEDPRRITVQVMGSERLPMAGGRFLDTWMVRALGIRDFVVTWWFVKETREQVQMRVSMPKGGEYWRVRLYGGADGGCG